MASFFISHSSQDRAAAEGVRDRLKAEGFESLFLAFDPIHGIPGGRNWERELYSQLRRTDAVIFLGSPAAVDSKWCFAELALARSIGKPVFPVLVAGEAQHPLLEDTQWIDLAGEGEAAFERLWRALTRHGFDPRATFVYYEGRSPYPGLAAFEPADAAVYFGRDKEIDELLGRLHPTLVRGAGRFVSVIGPSGSGKSSLVRAGLIPRLERLEDQWVVARAFTPGEEPVSALARVLAAALERAGVDGDWREVRRRIEGDRRALVEIARDLSNSGGEARRSVLLVVDQAEELSTLATDKERGAFLRIVRSALGGMGPLWTVATFRSELLTSHLHDPAIADLIAEPVVLGPLDRSRIAQVIEGPAHRAGVDFEPGLVGRMVEDTHGGDALPLLAYTLRHLYERAGPGRRITGADYEEIGGVLGAVRNQADRLADELGRRGKKELVLPTLLELTTLDAAGEPTRRPIKRADLGEAENEIVQAFIEARLLTSEGSEGDAVVEVAHEAMLRVWTPLSEAIEASRERLRFRAELERLAHEWEASGRRDAYLLREERLESARRVAATDAPDSAAWLGKSEREYLDASETLEEKRRDAARRRVRLTVGALAAALVLISFAAILAFWQSRIATSERDVARSRELAASALAQLEVDPELSILLAREAVGAARTDQAAEALRQSLRTSLVRMVLRGHREPVLTAAFSNDGKRILTLSDDDSARVWDAKSGRSLAVLRERDLVYSAAFSPDGKLVVTAGFDGAHVWDASSGKRISRLRGEGQYYDADFSPDSRLVLTAGDSGTPRVWDARTGRSVAVVRGNRLVGQAAPPTATPWKTTPSICAGEKQLSKGTATLESTNFSPDGELVVSDAGVWERSSGKQLAAFRKGNRLVPMSAAFSPDGKLVVTTDAERGSEVLRMARVWEARTGRILAALRGHTGLRTACFSPDSRLIVTAAEDGTASVWEARSGRHLAVLRGHGGAVSTARFSPDGKLIVTASDDGTARVWETASGRSFSVLRGHKGRVSTAAFSPDGRLVVTAGADGTTRVWQARSEERIVLLRGHMGSAATAAFSPNGKLVVTASSDGTARVWSASGTRLAVLRGPDGALGSASFSRDGKRVVVVSSQHTVRVWNLMRRASVRAIRAYRKSEGAAAVSGDGELVLTAAENNTARVWDAASGESLAVLRGHEGLVRRAAFSADGQFVLTASGDYTVGVWETNTGKQTARLPGGFSVTVAISRDGERVVTVFDDPSRPDWLRLWSGAGGQMLALLHGHTWVNNVAFSPDSKLFVTAGADGTARIWEAASGAEVVALRGHSGSVVTAAFNPASTLVVTAGDDGTARVWEAATGRTVAVFNAHRGRLSSVAFSPDGRRVITAGADGTARIYACELCGSIDDLLILARARVTRQLTRAERSTYLHEP